MKITFLENTSNNCVRLIKNTEPAFHAITFLQKLLFHNKQIILQMAKN